MYAKLKFTLELIHALNPIKKDEDTPTQKKRMQIVFIKITKDMRVLKKNRKRKEQRYMEIIMKIEQLAPSPEVFIMSEAKSCIKKESYRPMTARNIVLLYVKELKNKPSFKPSSISCQYTGVDNKYHRCG